MNDALAAAMRALPPAWRQALRGGATIAGGAPPSSPASPSSASSLAPPPPPPRLPAAVAALHALSAGLALSLGLLSFDGTLFGWHPLGMALGYQFFMAEGILAAVSLRATAAPGGGGGGCGAGAGADRARGIRAHAATQLRACACVAAGFGSIYLNKSLRGKPHFASRHAKLGLATLVATALAPVLGALAFRSWRLLQRLLGARERPSHLRAAKRAHRALGAATYFLSVLTVQLALGHSAVRKPWLTPLWRLMALAAAAGMAGALAAGTGLEGAGRIGGGDGGGADGGGGGGGSGGGAAPDEGGGGGRGEEEEPSGIKAV